MDIVIPNYLVGKDHRQFYVPADRLQYYVDNGYTIYRSRIEEVEDIEDELKKINEFMESELNEN